MDFTIVTPSFRQLDYLGCCIASVADQGTKGSENVGMCESANVRTHESKKDQISVEHIVQDAGSPGIEEFAKKMGEQLLRQYGGEQVSNLQTFELLHIRTAHGYALRIFKEKDSGMYDAVNQGLKKGTGKICAYLNCDEQYLIGTLQLLRMVFMVEAGTEVAFGGVAIVSPQGKLIARRMACHLSYSHVMTCHLPNFTAAMFFRREFLIKREAWFDVAYRDLADAVWVLARLREGTKIQRVSVITTAFTDTGANMNLSPNARREARELREAAPKWMKALKPLWKLFHRARKFLEGQYWPKAIEYALYLGGAAGERTEFRAKRASPLWWDRLYMKKEEPSAGENL
jgi:glycosyltransferase involved in cell wall biosynthesis